MKLETTTQIILQSKDYRTMAAKVRNQKRDIEAIISRLEQPRAGGLDNHFEEGIKYALKAVLGVDNSKEFNNACRWRNQILKNASVGQEQTKEKKHNE